MLDRCWGAAVTGAGTVLALREAEMLLLSSRKTTVGAAPEGFFVMGRKASPSRKHFT